MSEQVKQENVPKWLTGRGRVDEVEFAREYYRKHYLAYQDKAFFSPEGRITDEDALRRSIYQELSGYISTGVSARVDSIMSTLRLECPSKGLEERLEDIMDIPVANGTYRLDTGFSPMKHLTRYRLPVNYNPDAPEPVTWLKFLGELLHEEDIPTLQEYMGYCLVPSTIAQKMLIITGQGGEGKSRVGIVMKSLLGCNMCVNSIAKVEQNPFARADLQHMLLMVDDDLRMDALKSTNYLKSIITAELPMDLERKGVQSYQGKLNVRFLAFGNETLQALHDRSHGFFRRQIILTAKEKDPKRKDDPYLRYLLEGEREGILLWCLEGLQRLIVSDFQFTISKRAAENLRESISRGNNIPEFMASDGYIRYEADAVITSRNLYETYRDWCADNALIPLAAATFWGYLSQNLVTYGLTITRSIPIGNGKYARGYQGLRALN